jgi:hypothetical protein
MHRVLLNLMAVTLQRGNKNSEDIYCAMPKAISGKDPTEQGLEKFASN